MLQQPGVLLRHQFCLPVWTPGLRFRILDGYGLHGKSAARPMLAPYTRLPFTPGWDLVGLVDRLGDGVSGIEPGQTVAAMPIHGAYAEFICLPEGELVP